MIQNMLKTNKRTICIVTLVICKISVLVYLYRHYGTEIHEGLFIVSTNASAFTILITVRLCTITGIGRLIFFMKTTKYSSVLMTFIICLSNIPPLVGFAFLVSMSGYIYGFPFGVLPAILGACMGAFITFAMIRKLHLHKRTKPGKRYLAIAKAIDRGGFKMILLIRMSPIPWHLTNIILSTNHHISFRVYCMASCAGSFKLMLTVWLGSQLASLNDPNLPPEMQKYTLIGLGIGVLALVTVAFWMYKLTMKNIKDKKLEQEPLLGYSESARKYSECAGKYSP